MVKTGQPFHMAPVYDNDLYVVEDMHIGGATVSRTVLHPGKSTRGHSHDHEEAYLFTHGSAVIHLGVDSFDTSEGDAWAILPGEHHRVESEGGCTFLAVFVGER